ncbi:MAG: hypothetical protein NTX57_06205, partial [Armatimonadetes bacterium]|nr:hypothetical protein [Armatimonadota bacterium]
MNIYKNNILITLLSLLILDSNKTARSQEVIENADVILPRPEEYIGFKIRLIRGNLKFPKEENAGNIHNFEIKNESTGCNIGIN